MIGISMKKRMKRCVLERTKGDNRVIRQMSEDVSKVVGQLQFGSFTRLRLTLRPLSENYIGFLRQSNHHQRSIHCQHAQKVPWAQETSMQCSTHVKTPDHSLTNSICRDYGSHGINIIFTTSHVPRILYGERGHSSNRNGRQSL